MSKTENFNVQQIVTFARNIAGSRNLEVSAIFDAFKKSFEKIIYETYDPDANLEFIIDEDKNIFKIINHSKIVIDDPKGKTRNEQLKELDNIKRCIEIPYSEAIKINPNVKVGDEISEEIDLNSLTNSDHRKIALNFQTIINDDQKEIIWNQYQNRINDIVSAKVIAINKNGAILELVEDKNVTAYLPFSSLAERDLSKLRTASSIKVCIIGKSEEYKGAHLLVSISSSQIIRKLLFDEIPEIHDGFIEIVDIARLEGIRTKVSVRKSPSASKDIEELGSIIGKNGQRITAISEKLNGEKIDVIPYASELKDFIKNALSPAKVIDIISDGIKAKKNKPSFIVVVPNPHHTLAIGKKGHNVMLASELVNARLDIISQDQADERSIKYDFANGNITKEEIELLNQGQRLHANFANKKPHRNPTYNGPSSPNSFDIDNIFANEIAELRSKVGEANNFEDIVNNNESKGNLNSDLERTLDNDERTRRLHDNESDVESLIDKVSEEEKAKEKEASQKDDYDQIAKSKMKDFKQDDDLLSGIDISDIDDDDWE